MQNLPADRLRAKILWSGYQRPLITYKGGNLPYILRPDGFLRDYLEQAMEDLEASGNPTLARAYRVNRTSCGFAANGILYVWYKPVNKREVVGYRDMTVYGSNEPHHTRLKVWKNTRIWP